jgi:hypothetical protein
LDFFYHDRERLSSLYKIIDQLISSQLGALVLQDIIVHEIILKNRVQHEIIVQNNQVLISNVLVEPIHPLELVVVLPVKQKNIVLHDQVLVVLHKRDIIQTLLVVRRRVRTSQPTLITQVMQVVIVVLGSVIVDTKNLEVVV